MKRTIRTLSLLVVALLFGTTAMAQDVWGTWKTIDDETGEAKSEVEIYEKDGKPYGKILKLYDEDAKELCDKCPDETKFNGKDKPIIGLNIIVGMEKKGKSWKGDEAIIDPANGKIYDCEIELDPKDPNILLVRGFIWYFYRTQTWHRI